jgi:hypothetical protein
MFLNTVPSNDHAVPIVVVLVLRLIHTHHAVPLPCCAVALRSRFQNGIDGLRQGKCELAFRTLSEQVIWLGHQ